MEIVGRTKNQGIWYISVKDNLKKHVSFLKKTIRANETVCDILKNGYKLLFLYTPPNV